MTFSASREQMRKDLESRREFLLDMIATYERFQNRVLRQTMALERETPEWWGKMNEKIYNEQELTSYRLQLKENDELLAMIEQQPTQPSITGPHRSTNIVELALANNVKRVRVGANSTAQVEIFLQSLTPGSGNSIPRERHPGTTQLIQCVAGTGVVIFDNGRQQLLEPGSLVTIAADTWHEVQSIGVGNTAFKFISFYSPPERK